MARTRNPGPFDDNARDAGFDDTALPLTPASVVYAIHGPDGDEDPALADLDSLRSLLRSCRRPGAVEALDGENSEPDMTLAVIAAVEGMYRRLARLTGLRTDIYDDETA